ncbi:hypothetical protein [Streptomyces canus]|uniref:hypothetical protein n=1 Tax=Streptomyces canus TaxID=58343 RepID=UPI00324800E4
MAFLVRPLRRPEHLHETSEVVPDTAPDVHDRCPTRPGARLKKSYGSPATRLQLALAALVGLCLVLCALVTVEAADELVPEP